MYNLKSLKEKIKNIEWEELILALAEKKHIIGKSCTILISICLIVFVANIISKIGDNYDNEIGFTLTPLPIAETQAKTDVIDIPPGIVKANPFLPYRRLNSDIPVNALVEDVPRFDLVTPPDFSEGNSEAAKIMDTVVSGILYDKYSPSAILNIDGSDYLVKKGDVVHGYKVLNIASNSVTVQHGKNSYQAGIGELLSEGEINYNDISNINNKFGGRK